MSSVLITLAASIRSYKHPILTAPPTRASALPAPTTLSPSCVQARAAIFTGKYPHQCHAPAFITYLPEHERTFMSRLQEVGYYTAAIGKQHFGGSQIAHGYDYEDIVDIHTPEPQNPHKDSYCQWLHDCGFTHSGYLIQLHAGPDHLAEWKADPKYHVDHYVGNRGRQWL